MTIIEYILGVTEIHTFTEMFAKSCKSPKICGVFYSHMAV